MPSDRQVEIDEAYRQGYAAGTESTLNVCVGDDEREVIAALKLRAEQAEAELSRVQQERDEARETARTLAHQLERRADGMDALTQQLRAERDALQQEIATLRQQIGEMADGIEALAGPRADDYGRIVTQVAKSLRALLQKGQ